MRRWCAPSRLSGRLGCWLGSAAGILGVSTGKSSDHPGEAAVILYTDESRTVNAPSSVDGVRTVAIPTTARAVTYGSAPQTTFETSVPSLSAATLAQAIVIKKQVAANLMRQNRRFRRGRGPEPGTNPREAALVIYVDRNRLPAQLPRPSTVCAFVNVVMDRLHVTRSYATASPTRLPLYGP